LEECLLEEAAEREEGDNRVGEELTNQLRSIDDQILDLRAEGEDTERKLLESVKTSVTEMKAGIDAERAQRLIVISNKIILLESKAMKA
jgi:hypothetical protein